MDNQSFVCGISGGDEVRCTYYSEKDGGVKGASPREVLVVHQVNSDVACSWFGNMNPTVVEMQVEAGTTNPCLRAKAVHIK